MACGDDLRERYLDWPARDAPIDLATEDPPHRSSGIEWWYLNGHFTATDGWRGSAFVAFFRHASTRRCHPVITYSHLVCWALVDPVGRQYLRQSSMDASAVELISRVLATDTVMDRRITWAVLGSLAQGRPPPPDHLLSGAVEIGEDTLHLRYGDIAELTGTEDGRYRVRTRSEDGRSALDLTLQPCKPPVKHGADGIVRSIYEGEWDGMYCYTVPRCQITGSFTTNGIERHVAIGTGWYDHEFGLRPRPSDEGLPETEITWKWAGLQLENGWDVSVYVLSSVDVRTGRSTVCDATAWAVSPSGERVELRDHLLEGRCDWVAPVTRNRYPTEWWLGAPVLDLELTLIADFPEQEFATIVVGRGFWEGRVAVTGTMMGRAVRGVGFVEVLPAQVGAHTSASSA